MSRGWRWLAAALMVATVLGTFMPRALLSGTEAIVTSTVSLRAEEPPWSPTGCADTSCTRGTPTPPAPTLTIAALGAMFVCLAAGAATRAARRNRLRASSLPRGTRLTLLRPPQFS
jgi:hypothetical protein